MLFASKLKSNLQFYIDFRQLNAMTIKKPNQVIQLLANRANYSKNFIIADCINIDDKLHY